MGALSPTHWVIIILVVVILFGSKKLPDAARGLGRSMRIFKSEVKEMQNEGKPAEATSDDATRQIPAPSPTEAPRAADSAATDSEKRSA